MKKVRIRVVGKVQGVGFRFFTKMTADRLKITGIVSNEDDGAVCIEAMGPADALNEFVNLVKQSPAPSGRVDHLDLSYDQSIKERKTFEVAY